MKLDDNGNLVFTDNDGNNSTISSYEYVDVSCDGETYSMDDIIAYASQPGDDENHALHENSCPSNGFDGDDRHHREGSESDCDFSFDRDDNVVIRPDHGNHTTHFNIEDHDMGCRTHDMDHTADYMNLIGAHKIDTHQSGYSTYGSSDQDQALC